MNVRSSREQVPFGYCICPISITIRSTLWEARPIAATLCAVVRGVKVMRTLVSTSCGEWPVPIDLHFFEALGPIKRAAGKWGSTGRCDIPLILLENLFQHLRDNETVRAFHILVMILPNTCHFQFDYIMWTGDIPPHDVWNQTRSDQLQIYDTLVKLLFKYFPNKLVFAAVGNHESAPADRYGSD